jgi:hypothetical protein
MCVKAGMRRRHQMTIHTCFSLHRMGTMPSVEITVLVPLEPVGSILLPRHDFRCRKRRSGYEFYMQLALQQVKSNLQRLRLILHRSDRPSSCVSVIEEWLFSLTPPPRHVEVSVPSQSVTVHHLESLLPETIRTALEDVGLEVAGPYSHQEKRNGISTTLGAVAVFLAERKKAKLEHDHREESVWSDIEVDDIADDKPVMQTKFFSTDSTINLQIKDFPREVSPESTLPDTQPSEEISGAFKVVSHQVFSPPRSSR